MIPMYGHFARLALFVAACFCSLPAIATFANNGDGTVTDTVTNLVWDQCLIGQSGASCTGTATALSWQAALGQSATIASAGPYKDFSDWRLPNAKELESLVDISRYSPALDVAIFPNAPNGNAWSSTVDVHAYGNAWTVDFLNGVLASTAHGSASYVRLVRGGQNADNTTFTPPPATKIVNAGVVTDTVTSLVWDQCLIGQSGASCTGSATGLNWQAALSQSSTIASAGPYKGFSDWRLPNAKELESLTDNSRYSPALDVAIFPNAPNGNAWSSTVDVHAYGNAWTVDFLNGVLASTAHGSASYVRLVRGGQVSANADIIPPVFTAGPTITAGPTQSSLTFGVTSNEAATGYWLVIPRNATAPTAAQVKAGVNYGAVTIAGYGFGAMTAAVAATFSVTGLTAGTSYDLYVAGEDTAGNLQASPTSLLFTTLVLAPTDTTPPVFTAGPTITAGPTQSGATFSVTLNENGHIYLITVPAAATPPTAAQVRAHVSYAGGTVVGSSDYALLASTATSLPATFPSPGTAYKVYMVASDTAGNLQTSPTSLSVTTTTASAATCGTANGQAYAAMPTTTAELCSQGTPTSLSQSGPWTWSCNATSGGATAACTTAAVSACSSSPVLSIARVNLKDAANAAYVTNQAAIKQTYNVSCASGRFGVVRMPAQHNAYGLVQSSCYLFITPQIDGGLATTNEVLNAITAAGSGYTDATAALLSDPFVGPLARAICQ